MIRNFVQRALLINSMRYVRPQYGINHIIDTAAQSKWIDDRDPKTNVSLARNIPIEKEDDILYLEDNEVEARIIKVIRAFEKFDLKKIDWEGDLQKDVGLDSLERVALVTSIEHEFTVVFEDRLFDNLHSLAQIKEQIRKDNSAF